MKKQNFNYILLSVFLIVLGMCMSCTSTSEVQTSATIDNNLYYTNEQTGEKLRIDQWKYMGFDNPFPEWVIPALENNQERIKELIPELAETEIVILTGFGYNIDQAENSLREQKAPMDYNLYDNFWVGIYPEKYISVAVYYKK